MSDKEAIDRLFNMFAEDDESAARMWGFKEKPPVETKSEGGNDNNTELEKALHTITSDDPPKP